MTSVGTNVQFVECKKYICDIIEKVINVAAEFSALTTGIDENPTLSTVFEIVATDDIKTSAEKLQLNLSIIARDKMKCAFFGKTSNGKSAVINAILKAQILPSSQGRTTSCFIAVEGCDSDDGYLIDTNGDRRDADYINNIANELSQESYEIKSQVTLFWPKHNCPLLQNEIIFLDSPGVDFSSEHQDWIQSYCQDADVFVYVVDACSTINDSEKTFFKHVKSVVANPNIFILMNKWDKCENEVPASKLMRVKRQHLATVKKFFQDDLKIDSDFQGRTFFVSAKEMLEECTSLEQTQRKEEFNRFVDVMHDEMGHKAIITKFKPHLIKVNEFLQQVIDSVGTILDMRGDTDPIHFNEAELNDKIRSHFLKVSSSLEEVITKESKDFVCFIIEDCYELSNYDEKINNLAQRIIHFLNQTLMSMTCTILNEIKVELATLSQLKDDIGVMDNYFPSTTNNDVNLEPSIDYTSSPSIDDKKVVAKTENETAALIKNDLASTIAIIMPLNIELALILTNERIARLKEKRSKSILKDSSKEKLIIKIKNVLITLFGKCLKQHQETICTMTMILTDKFLKDQRQCGQVMATLDQIRSKCMTINDDISLEMWKIMSLENHHRP